ncbi:hypothetical protein BC831DRAFT_239070 [Entophlyctis helioformis]|nr:hypothetical protein BC831DRAFT_239070 [Entophlyctis helioformis]
MNLERSNTESRPPGMPKPLASSSVATANPFMDDQRHCINNAPSELCHHDHEHLVARRQESAQNDMASKPLCLQEHIRELENLALVIRELQVPTHGIISQTMERLVELAGSRDFLPAFSSLQRCIMRAKWARDDVFGAGYIIRGFRSTGTLAAGLDSAMWPISMSTRARLRRWIPSRCRPRRCRRLVVVVGIGVSGFIPHCPVVAVCRTACPPRTPTAATTQLRWRCPPMELDARRL